MLNSTDRKLLIHAPLTLGHEVIWSVELMFWVKYKFLWSCNEGISYCWVAVSVYTIKTAISDSFCMI